MHTAVTLRNGVWVTVGAKGNQRENQRGIRAKTRSADEPRRKYATTKILKKIVNREPAR